MSCDTETEYTFDPIEIDPGETRKVELDLFGKCANFWRANEQYSAGEFVRLSRPTGFSYECTTAGTSGAREPYGARAIDQVLEDGSVQWTSRPAGANGITPIVNPNASSDPVGLDVTAVTVSESCKILAIYAAPGSSDGDEFDAVFTFTLNGVLRVARQTVQIRRQ